MVSGIVFGFMIGGTRGNDHRLSGSATRFDPNIEPMALGNSAVSLHRTHRMSILPRQRFRNYEMRICLTGSRMVTLVG